MSPQNLVETVQRASVTTTRTSATVQPVTVSTANTILLVSGVNDVRTVHMVMPPNSSARVSVFLVFLSDTSLEYNI